MLFFTSLLLRAHATSRREFGKANHGPKYETIARTMIRDSNPGLSDDFAVVMLRVEEGLLDKIGVSPTLRKMPDNICVYEFLLFGYIAYVNVDQRHTVPLKAAQLTPGKPLVLVERLMEEASFFDLINEEQLKVNEFQLEPCLNDLTR